MTIAARKTPTLADRWQPAHNSFGLLRISAAIGVLVAHSWPIGFGEGAPLYTATRTQADLGSLCLYAFLFIGGFLNTDSGLRYSAPQFAWRRFIRIFPGLWTCLLVTAFVLAPFAAHYEDGSLSGFWDHQHGPLSYVTKNVFASMDQFPISNTLATTPWGKLTGGPSAWDGSLWTLRYEFGCYAFLGVLIALGVLKRRRGIVLALAAAGWALIAYDVSRVGDLSIRIDHPGTLHAAKHIPLLGSFSYPWILLFGFLFLLGSVSRLYLERIPIHPALAAVALVVMVVTCRQGGFLLVGLFAYAYLLLYAVVALPDVCTRLARRNDYSYGVYIYAFPVQQVVSLVGGNEHGKAVYIGLVLLGTFALAVPSWHLIERPCLRFKDRTFSHKEADADLVV